MQKKYLAFALLGLAFMPRPADSATATGTMNVSATVVAACTVSATPLAFGNYVGDALDGTSTITVNCGNGVAYGVELSAGSGSPTSTTRAMASSGGDPLDYEIYTDAGRSTVWAVGASGSQPGTGTGADQSLTAYGRIPSGQSAPAGSYTDALTITVTY